jgi:hypothetical protein
VTPALRTIAATDLGDRIVVLELLAFFRFRFSDELIDTDLATAQVN